MEKFTKEYILNHLENCSQYSYFFFVQGMINQLDIVDSLVLKITGLPACDEILSEHGTLYLLTSNDMVPLIILNGGSKFIHGELDHSALAKSANLFFRFMETDCHLYKFYYLKDLYRRYLLERHH